MNKMTNNRKIYDLEVLCETLKQVRGSRKVVHCHGVFDLLHIGHIRHFEQAKKFGDILVVTVTPDKFVNKGPGHPAFTESLRIEAIASLNCVDYVAINQWPTAVETVKMIKPDFYAKGSEYQNAENKSNNWIKVEKDAVEELGGEVVFTSDITFSSSNLINNYIPVFSDEVNEYLKTLRGRYSSNHIIDIINAVQGLRVLVIGETIIDEYHYVSTMGKSMKEPILASKLIREEAFAGGALAIANHVASFADHVDLVTVLGDYQTKENQVIRSLKENVTPKFFYKKDSPTIVKRRFIESEVLQKLFEIYIINDKQLKRSTEKKMCEYLEEKLSDYDVVLVADYGHGMFTMSSIDMLCDKSKFLAVNTQANAGNQGHNAISKYPKADFISLARHEMVLEFRNSHLSTEEMILETSKRLSCKNIICTMGKYGTLAARNDSISHTPAIAPKVVDRVGAGDAVLSITSLLSCINAPLDIVGFLGNAAGAEAVATIGNQSTLEKKPFIKHIESLLK